eukprot:COSAG05_NODE_71_length_22071_cov_17.527149_16_plen_59_part_00
MSKYRAVRGSPGGLHTTLRCTVLAERHEMVEHDEDGGKEAERVAEGCQLLVVHMTVTI